MQSWAAGLHHAGVRMRKCLQLDPSPECMHDPVVAEPYLRLAPTEVGSYCNLSTASRLKKLEEFLHPEEAVVFGSRNAIPFQKILLSIVLNVGSVLRE